jgi:tRNA (mo5U34)-methyltransferase
MKATMLADSTTLQRRIHELGDWFHNVRIAGVQTAPHHPLGDYPAVKWRRFEHALPKDLSGMSVLDIGCNAGFYSVEMKRRGADRVVAIDTDERYLAQARFVAETANVSIEFRNLSIYDVAQIGERFDLVLCLGVLYHLRHPLLALDRMHEHVCGDWLVVQSMLRGVRDSGFRPRVDYPFTEEAAFLSREFPAMYFVEHSYAGDPTNWWIPNHACLAGMIRSAGFSIEDTPEEEVFVCRRLRGSAARLAFIG